MSQTPEEILHHYWGHTAFRPLQHDIIQSVLNGKDTLALLPTGGGKSVCFQVPAMAMQGLCIVISPLVALMKDQVERLRQLRIKAEAMFAGMQNEGLLAALSSCKYGGTKFLYVSPERLQTKLFLENIVSLPVTLIAVDEAHCISQWGFDFRPEYRQINTLRQMFPTVPVIALTATATKKVISDIQVQLGFHKPNVFTGSFFRNNLAYIVRKTEDKRSSILKILQGVKGSALIYVRSRKAASEISAWLVQEKYSASYYHAGLSADERSIRQLSWLRNETRIMVCTNAFGMGIDKPDCRLVIHEEMPENLEAYYQEAGRAGRDGLHSYCVLLCGPADISEFDFRLNQAFPEEKVLQKVYENICSFFHVPMGNLMAEPQSFDLVQFSQQYKYDIGLVKTAVQLFEQLQLLQASVSFYQPSQVQFICGHDILLRFQALNPNFEPIIQFLLRSYGGLFEQPHEIQETFIATKLGITKEKTKALLRQLHEMKIISYQAQNEGIKLQLIAPRIEAAHLQFEEVFYKFRKQRYIEKAEAMKAYISEEVHCRSRTILRYFEEIDSNDCGICDTCLAKKKTKSGVKEAELRTYIQSIVLREPIAVSALTEALNIFTEDQVLNCCRLMIDEGLVKFDELSRLHWIGKGK